MFGNSPVAHRVSDKEKVMKYSEGWEMVRPWKIPASTKK